GASSEQIKSDVVELIHIFYEVLGGKKHYHNLPPEIKDIICGLKRSLITKKFKTAGKLREYLENMEWN
ncbi:serine/threonine protein kinase, partial [Candidatus Woesearchaeota archaeon]|nr:serine/threonine protein kinase [Candidatus Woesearchaeota archaeon]